MNYASVAVTTKVELIDDFLAWVDGLDTKSQQRLG